MSVLDAVYAVDQPAERWLSGVLQSILPTLDLGAGVGGLLYDLSGGDRLNIDLIDTLNAPSGWREVGRALHSDPRFVPEIIALYRSRLCTTLAENTKDVPAAENLQSDVYDRYEVKGQVMINGVDCSGKGCVLYLFSRRPVTLSEPQRYLLSRLATHLTTAYRLQRRLTGGEAAKAAGVQAVLKPSGEVDHAEAEATSAESRRDLKHAVLRRERARDLTTKDTELVMRSLKGLVDARWTLVDQYENDGKRFVLARENAPTPVDPGRLSRREQQVVALAVLGRTNKLIAYELGLAYSTVRVLLARACVKVGAKNRSELLALQRPAAPADSD